METPGTRSKKIESLLSENRIQEAILQFDEFLYRCEIARNDLPQLQRRMAEAEKQAGQATAGPEIAIEKNRIAMTLMDMLQRFRKDVMGVYFNIGDREKFFAEITSRDTVIHEIIDLRLLPKRFEREEQLAEGNSSLVYRLLNPDTRRHAVALVFKAPSLNEETKQRIEYLLDIRHRNVIKVLDIDLSAFPYFVIMEFVYGVNLPAALERVGPRPIAQASDWLYQLTDALNYLRHKRIVHTNVRPSKIYIDDEWQIMISPFDLLKASTTSASTGLTEEFTYNRYRDICQYGSPELLACDGVCLEPEATGTSDQYALGLVAYKMLTGKDLFAGHSIQAILESRRRFREDTAYREQKLQALPKSPFVDIVHKLLQDDPNNRFADLHQLLKALHPLTRAEELDVSEARRSYRRCLGANREFIRDFYRTLDQKIPEAKGAFSFIAQKRQSAMMQMAVDVLIDGGREGRRLKSIFNHDSHRPYTKPQMELFLQALVDCIRQNDPQWDQQVEQAWNDVYQNALEVLHS